MAKITCFLATGDAETVEQLQADPLVDAVYCVPGFSRTEDILRVAADTTGDYTLIYNKPTRLLWIHHALHRLLQIADDTGAALIYSDRFKLENGVESQAPVIDYQPGSLRDDFDFGSVMVFRTSCLKQAVAGMGAYIGVDSSTRPCGLGRNDMEGNPNPCGLGRNDMEGNPNPCGLGRNDMGVIPGVLGVGTGASGVALSEPHSVIPSEVPSVIPSEVEESPVMPGLTGHLLASYKYAGLYDLRLRVSRLGPVVHVNEFLYYDIELDSRQFGEKLFDYVNPRNREVQIEMEAACTAHLKAIGGYLEPVFKEVDLRSEAFEYEASVVIPCRNRARTIADAIRSALAQETSFKYNVIVVDDNSTDGAAEIISQLAAENPDKLVYIAQDRTYHAIGGNWNAALHHPKCGRFALQLDSDDVYSGPETVQKFVDAFYAQNCAMVIGSYQITDINLKPADMAPIEHREWTADNGRNNALRVNGLGAPRGFFTPLVREMTFPTTKYGEDYAVALRISREYRIGRIYDVMYYCRRWEGNSDASLDVATANRYNTYKDRIRTWELEARIAANASRR